MPETTMPASSAVSGNSETTQSLTLQQLQEALNARGTTIGYSTLSEFIKTGDIAEILGAGGSGSRRAFDPSLVDILAGFFTEFRAAGGKLPQAPTMLRGFLRQHDAGTSGSLVPLSASNSLVPNFSETPKQTSDAALPAALEHLASAILSLEKRQAPVEDRLLTAEQAAEMLACHPRSVSRYVAPVRPRTWRESDCLRYIARLGEALEDAEREAAK